MSKETLCHARLQGLGEWAAHLRSSRTLKASAACSSGYLSPAPSTPGRGSQFAMRHR